MGLADPKFGLGLAGLGVRFQIAAGSEISPGRHEAITPLEALPNPAKTVDNSADNTKTKSRSPDGALRPAQDQAQRRNPNKRQV